MNESIKVRDSFAEEDLRRIQEKALIFTEQFPQITEITLHKFIDHNADPFLPEPQRKEKHILVFRHDGIFDDVYQEGEFYEAAAAFLAWEDLGTLKNRECAIDLIGLDDPLPKQASRMITPVSLYVRHDKEETTREKKKTDNFSNGGKGGVCIPRKFTGHEIVESFGLLDSGIFDLLKDGLQAYTSGTEKKVVNLDSLPKKRRYSLEEIVLRERLEEGKQATGKVMGSGYPHQREARSEEEITRDARRKWSMQPENVLITPDGCYALSFTLPYDDLKRKNAIEEALSFIFKAKDVEEYGRVNGFISSGPSNTHTPQEQAEKPEEKVPETKPSYTNFFIRRKDKHWRIGFNGKESIINHLNGISFIAILLGKPGTAVSCRELYQATSGQMSGKTLTKGAAIAEDLNMDHRKQEVNTPEARDNYLKRYMDLEDDLLKINDLRDNERTPEDEVARREIEKEMDAISKCLHEKNFVDDEKKAQANVIKRLNAAYGSICDAGMKELANYLRKNIKSDRAYGLIYTGDIDWKIITR